MTGSPNKLYRWLVLGLLFPLVFINGWLALRVLQYFQPLVTVFVLATLLAFILNYPVSILQQSGLKRNNAVLLVFGPTLLILVALGITLVPFLLEEFNEVTKLIPQWINSGTQQVQAFDAWAGTRRLPVSLRQLVAQLTNRLPNELHYLADEIFHLALNTIDSISEALLTLVLTFYLVLDGSRIWEGISQKLPSNLGTQVQQSLQQNFQNYFLGQIALACLVGVSMTLTFLVLQVPFGLIFGLGVGIMSLIPFGDVLSLGAITILIASHNFWLGVKVLVAATIIDQVIDQAIAPRLLGGFTGLRPVWVLVSLLIGTKIGGLLGLLIAVPLASSVKSVVDDWQVPSISGHTDNAAKLPATQTNSSEAGEASPEMLTKES